MRRLWHWLMLTLGPLVAFAVIKFLQRTVCCQEVNAELVRQYAQEGKNVIMVFWHGRLLMMPLILSGYPDRRANVLVSRHRDGEFIRRTVKFFGVGTVRGSSTRGGISGMKEMVRTLRDGYDAVIAPDGPRGPRYKVQPGVIQLAKISGCPILPVTFSASRRKAMQTWDHFLIPYPFSRGVFMWGEPVCVNPDGDDQEIEKNTLLLERRLQEITEAADHYFG